MTQTFSTDAPSSTAGTSTLPTIPENSPGPAKQEIPAPDVPSAVRRAWADNESDGEFDYVPVSPWAPVSLALGLLSLTGFMGFFGLYVAGFSIFVGLAALAKIRSGGGTVKGKGMAIPGLLLAIVSLAGGSVKMAYAYNTEVPAGFQRVHFPREIADHQFVYINGRRKIPPAVAELVGKPVYLKGFMWATQATDGIPRFILLKDNGECCFGGKPKSHDFITVTLKSYPDGARPPLASRAPGMSDARLTPEQQKALGAAHPNQLTTQAFIGMVAVAGILHANPQAGEGGSPEDYDFAPVYTMDADLVEEVWTPF